MRINAIRLKSEASAEFQTWKFHSGQGKYAGFAVCQVDRHTRELLVEVLEWSLLSKLPSHLYEAAINLSDDAGNSWIIEKSERGTKVLRNGKPLPETESAKDVMRLIVEADHGNVSPIDERLNYLASYQIAYKSNQFYGETEIDRKTLEGEVSRFAIKRIRAHVRDCRQILHNQWSGDQSVITRLSSKLLPIHQAVNEVNRLKRDLPKLLPSVDISHQGDVEQLEQQVEIVEAIAKIASPLLEPRANPALLKEKLAQTDQELKNACKETGQSTHLRVDEDTPWSKLVEALTRVDIFKKMLVASESAMTNCHERFAPTIKEYLSTINDILSNDRRITSELESCLGLIATQVHRQQTAAARTNRLSKMLHSFFKPDGHSETPLEETTLTPVDALDDIRQCIDFALARLGELHSETSEAQSIHDEFLTRLQSTHDAIANEYRRAQQNWEKLAGPFGLSSHMNLRELLRLITLRGRVIELQQQRDHFAKQLSERQAKLSQIENLIVEWRQVTGSQKQGSLSTPELVLAEAQSIIRFADQKRDVLAKVRRHTEELRAHHAMKQQLERRAQHLMSKWETALDELALPCLPPSDRTWETLFARANQVSALQELVSEASKPWVLGDLLADGSLQTPVTLLTMSHVLETPSERLALLQHIDRFNLDSSTILFTDDAALAEMLLNIGAGKLIQMNTGVRRVPITSSSTPSNTSESAANDKELLDDARPAASQPLMDRKAAVARPRMAPQAGQQQILSQRAKAALAVFNYNRTIEK